MKYQKSKELVKKITEQQIKKTGINLNVTPLTKTENIIYSLKNELKPLLNYNPKQIKEFIAINFFDHSHGYFDSETNIIKILLSSIRNNKTHSPNNNYYLTNLLRITYHEIYHKIYDEILKNNPNLDLNKFIYLIEEDQQDNSELYQKYREQFYTEITAELYSYQQTKNILQQHPNIYQEVSAYLESLELYQKVLYINYDVEALLNKYNQDIILLLGDKQINRTLILDNNWKKEELETKYTILSSKYFLSKIAYQNLTSEELQVLLEAINFSLEKLDNKETANQELLSKIEELEIKFPKYINLISQIDDILLKKQHRNNNKANYLKLQIYNINKELKSRNNNSNSKTRQLNR